MNKINSMENFCNLDFQVKYLSTVSILSKKNLFGNNCKNTKDLELVLEKFGK